MAFDQQSMEKLAKPVEVHVGRQGRLVIPAALRQSIGLREGDTLVVYQEAGRLVLEKPAMVKQRLQARFATVPQGQSLAEELITQRRQEAQQEITE